MTRTKQTTPAEKIATAEAKLAATLPRWQRLAPVSAMVASADAAGEPYQGAA